MRSARVLQIVSSISLLYRIITTIIPGSLRQVGIVKNSDLPLPISSTTISVVSTSSIIRFSATSYSSNRYVSIAFFGLPSAFFTTCDCSSSPSRANLETTTSRFISKRRDSSLSI